MKSIQEVIEEVVGAYEYGYRGKNGAVDILREYANEIIDRCSDPTKVQTLGIGDDEVWIYKGSIQDVKKEIV